MILIYPDDIKAILGFIGCISIIILIGLAITLLLLGMIMALEDINSDDELETYYVFTILNKSITDDEKYPFCIVDQGNREWVVDCTPYEYSQFAANKTYLALINANYDYCPHLLDGNFTKTKYLSITEELPLDYKIKGVGTSDAST